jgi:hypothetical protein
MEFVNITSYIVIGGAVICCAATLWEISKIKQEDPASKIYRELLVQKLMMWVLIIVLVLRNITIYIWV